MRQGLVGCIELGQTEAAMMFGGVLYRGIVTRFQHPYYQVTYEDGDVEEYTGRELACILKFKVSEIADPRRFYYDWSGLSMADVPGFVEHLAEYLAQFDIKLPTAWTDRGTREDTGARDGMCSGDAIETFLRDEEHELRWFHEGLLSSARAARTLRNYRLAALKLVWYAFTRRLAWPLTGDAFELYLVKLYKDATTLARQPQPKTP